MNTKFDFDKSVLNDVYSQMFGIEEKLVIEQKVHYDQTLFPVHYQVETEDLETKLGIMGQSVIDDPNDWITINETQSLPTSMMPKSSSCLEIEGTKSRHDQKNSQYQFMLPYAYSSDTQETEVSALARNNPGEGHFLLNQSDTEKECIDIGEQNIIISDVSVRSMSESIIVSNTNKYYYSDTSEGITNINILNNQKENDIAKNSVSSKKRSTTFKENKNKQRTKINKMPHSSSKRKQSVPSKLASSKKRKNLLKNVPGVNKDGLVPTDTWTPRKRFISKYKTLKNTLEEVIATERAYRSINIHQGEQPPPNIKSLLTKLGTEAVRMAHAQNVKSSTDMYPVFFVWAKKSPPNEDSPTT